MFHFTHLCLCLAFVCCVQTEGRNAPGFILHLHPIQRIRQTWLMWTSLTNQSILCPYYRCRFPLCRSHVFVCLGSYHIEHTGSFQPRSRHQQLKHGCSRTAAGGRGGFRETGEEAEDRDGVSCGSSSLACSQRMKKLQMYFSLPFRDLFEECSWMLFWSNSYPKATQLKVHV